MLSQNSTSSLLHKLVYWTAISRFAAKSRFQQFSNLIIRSLLKNKGRNHSCFGRKRKFVCDDGEEIVNAGDCHYCPKGCGHSLQSPAGGFIDFFAVVPELA